MRTTSAPPWNAASAFQPFAATGSMRRARSKCTWKREFIAVSAAATFTVRSSSPFSGMQMSLHTIQSAFAFTA